MSTPLADTFAGRPVLVTGHTGFKGSWLSIWLRELGARVIGFSLPDLPTTPSNFQTCQLGERLLDLRGDVRDYGALRQVIERYRPEVVFHLAAQPLVLHAYEDPRETFETNVSGTVNLLEAVRTTDSVQAVVCITTDKVYENRGWVWGYRENDRLGGYDPYSSSKAMAELAIAAYRRSFFAEGSPALASTRAGNVIGGGDFAANRLVPDCMRALLDGRPVDVRNPAHVRPWQHVLESLSGYLWLAVKLLEQGQPFAEAWNFAPVEINGVSTQMVVQKVLELWGAGSWQHVPDASAQKESSTLRLSWDKAANRLEWRPIYNWEEALAATVAWFRCYEEQLPQPQMYEMCVAQIEDYTARAREMGLAWAGRQEEAGSG